MFGWNGLAGESRVAETGGPLTGGRDGGGTFPLPEHSTSLLRKGRFMSTTFAYINLRSQRPNVAVGCKLVVKPLNGTFDTSFGIGHQIFNYGDGKENLASDGVTLTESQFTFEWLLVPWADHNFTLRMATDADGQDLDPKIVSGTGMDIFEHGITKALKVHIDTHHKKK